MTKTKTAKTPKADKPKKAKPDKKADVGFMGFQGVKNKKQKDAVAAVAKVVAERLGLGSPMDVHFDGSYDSRRKNREWAVHVVASSTTLFDTRQFWTRGITENLPVVVAAEAVLNNFGKKAKKVKIKGQKKAVTVDGYAEADRKSVV